MITEERLDRLMRSIWQTPLTALNNAGGSAFDKWLIAHYSNGVLFWVNQHGIFGISIAPTPDSKIKLGCQNAHIYGDPWPRLEDGEWTEVFRSSNPVLKQGPWVPAIEREMKKLEKKVAKELERLEEQKKQRWRTNEQMQLEKERKLVGAWS